MLTLEAVGVPLAGKIDFESSPARGRGQVIQINPSAAESRASGCSSALQTKTWG